MKNSSVTDFIITNKFTGKPLQPVILALDMSLSSLRSGMSLFNEGQYTQDGSTT